MRHHLLEASEACLSKVALLLSRLSTSPAPCSSWLEDPVCDPDATNSRASAERVLPCTATSIGERMWRARDRFSTDLLVTGQQGEGAYQVRHIPVQWSSRYIVLDQIPLKICKM